MKKLSLLLIAASALLSVNALAGPIGTYYITDGTAGKILAIQGSSTGSTDMKDQTNKSELPIAIVGVGMEVHTTGMNSDYSGSAYTGVNALNLTPTATVYPNTVDGTMRDGTSNGSTYNYAVTYGQGGGTDAAKVLRFDTAWGDQQTQFILTDSNKDSWTGITFDRASRDALWLSNLAAKVIAKFDFAGNELFRFSTAAEAGMYALAMDIDDTL